MPGAYRVLSLKPSYAERLWESPWIGQEARQWPAKGRWGQKRASLLSRRGGVEQGRGEEERRGRKGREKVSYILSRPLLWLQPGAFPGEPRGNPHTSVGLQRRGSQAVSWEEKCPPGPDLD